MTDVYIFMIDVFIIDVFIIDVCTVFMFMLRDWLKQIGGLLSLTMWGGRHSPAVACWASDHWVASSNPLRGKFRY